MDAKPEKSVCRVCLSVDKKNMSLFQEHKSIPIYLHINSLTNVCIKEDDGLPDVICTSCLLDLDTAISFKEKCESSDIFLRTAPHSQSTKDDDVKYIVVKKEEPQDKTEYPEVTINYSEPDSCHYDCDEKDEQIHKDDQPIDNLVRENSPNDAGSFEGAGNDSDFDLLDNNCDNEDVNIINEDNRPSTKPKVKLELKESRTINLQLQCDDCKGYFKSKCKLRVHWKKVHLTEALRCHRCKISFSSYKAFNKHKQLKVTNCILAENFRIEVEGKKRCFYCKECDYKTLIMNNMRTHWRRHTGDRPFKCDFCPKSFAQRGSLLAHKQCLHQENKKQVPCPDCGKLFMKSRIWHHLQTHKSKRIPCTVCQRELKSERSLKQHMIRHSGVKSITCEICAKTCYTNADLLNHKRQTHFKHKYTYSCDKCDYKCHTASLFNTHKSKHSNPKYMHCDLCGLFYKNLERFKRHKKNHFKADAYTCPHCDAKFRHRGSHYNHIKTYHSSLFSPTKKRASTFKKDLPDDE